MPPWILRSSPSLKGDPMQQGIRILVWGCCGLAQALGVQELGVLGSSVALARFVSPEAIGVEQTHLEVAICLQQWQNAIDLTTNLIGIPQISSDQRQAYVDLRHTLEDLQSRSPYPNFQVNFDDPRFPEEVSTDRCEAIQQKFRL